VRKSVFGTVIKHWTTHTEIKGSNQTAAIQQQKMAKKKAALQWPVMATHWVDN
jgi:hypothetical protein